MKLDRQNPPENWCFTIDPSNSGAMVLAKFSKSHYCWIGHDLQPIFIEGEHYPMLHDNQVYNYEETKYKTLYELKEMIK